MREVRFVCGTPGGPRSTIWKAWTAGNELYIQGKIMGSSTKVSIHSARSGEERGVGQFSMDATWFGRHRPGQPNASRHVDRWEWTLAPRGKASHVFVVGIPGASLTSQWTEPPLEGTLWLPVPNHDQKMMVHLFATREPSDPAPTHIPGYLFSLEMSDSDMSVVGVAHLGPLAPEDHAEIAKVQNSATARALEDGFVLGPTHRMVAGFTNPLGMHGLIEVVPVAS